MRFQASFSRTVLGGGVTTLGTDSAPTSAPSKLSDNQISGTLNNINGFPIQRFAMAVSAPNGSAAVPITVYMYEEETAAWYSCGAKSVTPGTIAYFDQPTLGQCGKQGGYNQSYSPGALDLCIVASAPVGAPDGTYRFAMGFDLSSSIGDSVNVSATVDSTTLAQKSQLPATIGQKTSALSTSVVIASDQSTLNIDSTTLAQKSQLPATIGQKTSALSTSVTLASDQSTLNIDSTTLAQKSQLPATIGQKAAAASTSVVIASDQSTLNVDSTTLAQKSQLPATLGQKTSALSTSVVIASDQFPTAAAIADATATPTVSKLSVFGLAYNGATWDFLRSGITTAVSSFTGVLNTLPLVKYVASPATLTDGQAVSMQADSKGNVRMAEQNSTTAELNTLGVVATAPRPLSGADLTPSIVSAQAATGVVIKAAPGVGYKLIYTNGNAAARYIQLHNATSAPADTTVPLLAVAVAAGASYTIDLGPFGAYFSTGIYACHSTSAFTKTLGSTDGGFFATYS